MQQSTFGYVLSVRRDYSHPLAYTQPAHERVCFAPREAGLAMTDVTRQCVIIAALLLLLNVPSYAQTEWPKVTSENKPWTRWWWMGSAVDTANLSVLMETYAQAGLGGLEIVPIYGVKGDEDHYIPYLSPAWMKALNYTLYKARELNLGIDLANGTGWPFGGKWVPDEYAAGCLYYKTFSLKQDEMLDKNILYEVPGWTRLVGKSVSIDQEKNHEFLKPFAVMAYAQDSTLNLTPLVNDSGTLEWKAPAGIWLVIALYSGKHGKMVERAAPGAEGYAIDHFSKTAVDNYLNHFEPALSTTDISPIRSFFNDSYEVDDARGQADWTSGLLDEFKTRRGYNLLDHLPALLHQHSDSSRVIYDYRLTVSELMLDNFTMPWKTWAHGKEALIRNQAHGSPANILDLYAASDIPETEGKELLRFKFASSAANVSGKKLVSAEAATWLDDHFLSSLGDVKKAADNYFLGGVNHLIYHGTAYSPLNDLWPGWLFYAAVHFQPSNPFWVHFPALNKYIALCQSFLQEGKPDNDILLYYPIADRFSDPGHQLLRHFDGLEKEFIGTPFRDNAEAMTKSGYAFDYLSDRQILELQFHNNKFITGGGSAYEVLVLPANRVMPVETWVHLFNLVKEGARIIAVQNLPDEVPGLSQYITNKKILQQLLSELSFVPAGMEGLQMAKHGKGYFITGENLHELLTFAGIRRESMTDSQLQFVRRQINGHTFYLVVNQSSNTYDNWLPVSSIFSSAMLFDPMTGRKGLAASRKAMNGQIEILIQLKPTESIIIMASPEKVKEERFNYLYAAGPPVNITGKWRVSFQDGGPVLPSPTEIMELTSWTTWSDPDLKSFSGTAKYSLHFKKPEGNSRQYLLDLGLVKESASVWLNGNYITTLIGDDFSTIIDAQLMKSDNLLDIVVANSMANRIITMDQQALPYKKFNNINFPAYVAANSGPDGLFTAARWEPLTSGLLGPITLTPLK